MDDSLHDDYWTAEEVPLPVMHAVQAAEAIREATYRMQRMQFARDEPEWLDPSSLAAVGAAFEDLTRGLAQFAGQVGAALPAAIEEHPAKSREIRDGLVAFRIAVLDASVAARGLGASAASVESEAVSHQRHG
jgi:hypothetical protein